MTEEEFQEIFDNFAQPQKWTGDNALQGLNIIVKYLPEKGIEGAGHDIIFAASIDEICEAGITFEDVKKLKELNWMIDEGALACFV
jgi:hypothetical protein